MIYPVRSGIGWVISAKKEEKKRRARLEFSKLTILLSNSKKVLKIVLKIILDTSASMIRKFQQQMKDALTIIGHS